MSQATSTPADTDSSNDQVSKHMQEIARFDLHIKVNQMLLASGHYDRDKLEAMIKSRNGHVWSALRITLNEVGMTVCRKCYCVCRRTHNVVIGSPSAAMTTRLCDSCFGFATGDGEVLAELRSTDASGMIDELDSLEYEVEIQPALEFDPSRDERKVQQILDIYGLPSLLKLVGDCVYSIHKF